MIGAARDEPRQQEDDEPTVDMEQIVGKAGFLADRQDQTMIGLRDMGKVRNEKALLVWNGLSVICTR